MSSSKASFRRHDWAFAMREQFRNSEEIASLLKSLASGDDSAKAKLIAHSQERLRRLAGKMLSRDPDVKRREQTDDVLQHAMMKLHRSLETVKPESVRAFIGLAALKIRQTLRDLHKKHYGRIGGGANFQSGAKVEELPDHQSPATKRLEIHEAVSRLRREEREVVDLHHYWRLTHQEIALLLNVSERTVKDRWARAKIHLRRTLSGD